MTLTTTGCSEALDDATLSTTCPEKAYQIEMNKGQSFEPNDPHCCSLMDSWVSMTMALWFAHSCIPRHRLACTFVLLFHDSLWCPAPWSEDVCWTWEHLHTRHLCAISTELLKEALWSHKLGHTNTPLTCSATLLDGWSTLCEPLCENRRRRGVGPFEQESLMSALWPMSIALVVVATGTAVIGVATSTAVVGVPCVTTTTLLVCTFPLASCPTSFPPSFTPSSRSSFPPSSSSFSSSFSLFHNSSSIWGFAAALGWSKLTLKGGCALCLAGSLVCSKWENKQSLWHQ